ncbi:MAG: RNA polymerase sigma factor [Gemmatimonadota bacterium]
MSAESEEPDRELVTAFLKARSERVFRILFQRHTPYVLGLLLRVSGGARDEAEDVLQETWLRAVRGLPGFRWESSLRTWLAGIAIRCWSEQARKKRAMAEPAPDNGPADQAARDLSIVRVDLERAVRRLGDDRRAVLVLHDVEGYTHEEIAGMLGIEPGTSKSRLHRARRALRAVLEPSDQQPQKGAG